MNILIIADEVWNDEIHGNNVLTNWFDGFDANFSEIYCSPGKPLNNICVNYFQITDKMMLKSILSPIKAGKKIIISGQLNCSTSILNIEDEDKKLYSFLKSITGDFLRLIRQIIWCCGRYDKAELCNFIKEQNPDIIFAARYSSLKLLRLEKKVKNYCNVPIVAYTGDDEYSLGQIKISPFYWITRLITRHVMRKQIPNYSLYYTHSFIQGKLYCTEFDIKTKVLLKTGNFEKQNVHKKVNDVIRIVYIGKLYCNRWKTLGIIVNMLNKINKNEKKAILEIYTLDKITKKQNILLNDKKNSYIMGGISPAEIPQIYNKSDIILHVESLDLKNRLLTKYSFSTKVIDSLASGCALWAIGWKEHCACQYLKENDCAIVSNTKDEIESDLLKIIHNNSIILEYANKAYLFGKENLQRNTVQKHIKQDFENIINNYKS